MSRMNARMLEQLLGGGAGLEQLLGGGRSSIEVHVLPRRGDRMPGQEEVEEEALRVAFDLPTSDLPCIHQLAHRIAKLGEMLRPIGGGVALRWKGVENLLARWLQPNPMFGAEPPANLEDLLFVLDRRAVILGLQNTLKALEEISALTPSAADAYAPLFEAIKAEIKSWEDLQEFSPDNETDTMTIEIEVRGARRDMESLMARTKEAVEGIAVDAFIEAGKRFGYEFSISPECEHVNASRDGKGFHFRHDVLDLEEKLAAAGISLAPARSPFGQHPDDDIEMELDDDLEVDESDDDESNGDDDSDVTLASGEDSEVDDQVGSASARS